MNTDRRTASRDRQDALEVYVHRLGTDRHLVTVEGVLDLHTASRLAGTLQPLPQRT